MEPKGVLELAPLPEKQQQQSWETLFAKVMPVMKRPLQLITSAVAQIHAAASYVETVNKSNATTVATRDHAAQTTVKDCLMCFTFSFWRRRRF